MISNAVKCTVVSVAWLLASCSISAGDAEAAGPGPTASEEEKCRSTNSGNTLAQIQLGDLGRIVDALQVLQRGQPHPELEKRLATMAITHVISIGVAKPVIETLNGHSIEVLCVVSRSFDELKLSELADPDLSKLAAQYLDTTRLKVNERLKQAQATFGGSGCSMSR